MKLFRKRQKLGNRGLSMIELLCSLAIMSILGMVAGSMLIVSANSYQRENADTDAQKEAQLVANQISDLLIDTTAEVEATNGVVDGRNRTSLLTIIQGTAGYEVEFVATENKLYYRQFTVDATGAKSNYTSKQLMAENLVNFYADVATFKETGNVKLDMVYAKGAGEYPAVFTVTARNKELMAGTAPAIFVSVPTEVILEPNQSYKINAPVSGAATGLTWSMVDSVSDSVTMIASDGTVKIGSNETINMFRVKVETTVKDDAGNPLVTKYVRVYVRKVTDAQATGTLVSGAPYKSGAVYNVTTEITGNNLQKAIGQNFDNDYVDAKTMGVSYSVSCSGISNSDFSFTSSPTGGATITLFTDMPEGAEIIVTATARHPLGTDGTNIFNKTGQPYYPAVIDTWVLRKPACVLNCEDGWKRKSDDPQATVIDARLAAVKPAGTWHEYEVMYREYPYGSYETGWLPNEYGGDGNNSSVVNLRPLFTGVLKYNKDYEIKIRLLVKKKEIQADGSEKIVTVWPTASTPEEEYVVQSVMKRVAVSFDSPSDVLDFEDLTQNNRDDAIAHPVTMTRHNGKKILEFNTVQGIKADEMRNAMVFVVEKEDASGNWMTCSNSDIEVNNESGSLKMTFRNITEISGLYRIKITAPQQTKYKLEPKTRADGSTYYDLAEDGREDYILWDEVTGNNIFYLYVNEG